MGKRHRKYRSFSSGSQQETTTIVPSPRKIIGDSTVGSSPVSGRSDLPGFYYDAARNRYFRIQSDGSSPSTSLYTQSKVRIMEIKKNAERTLASIKPESIVKLVSSVNRDRCHKHLFERKVKECRLSQMRLVLQQNVFENAEDFRQPCDPAARVFLSRVSGRSDLVGIYPEESGKISALHWFVCFHKATREDDTCFRIEAAPEPLLYCNGQVTDMCTQPYDMDNPHRSAAILWTVTGSLGRKSEAVMLRIYHEDANDPFLLSTFSPRAIRFDLGHSAVWSCTWNEPTANMAFGVERKNIVLSSFIDCGQKIVFNKGQQSFGLCFSDSGRELFSGTNNGLVVCSDFRMKVSSQCSYSFEVGKTITRLQVLPESMVLVSGYDDLLSTYDLRNTRRPLLSYPNHKNDYHHFSPSICVEDEVLCSVGSDCIVRLWNLNSGKLLSQLKPTADVQAKNMAVTYCPQSEDNIRPSVVVIAKDYFNVYQNF